jgi:hypothetical protein
LGVNSDCSLRNNPLYSLYLPFFGGGYRGWLLLGGSTSNLIGSFLDNVRIIKISAPIQSLG